MAAGASRAGNGLIQFAVAPNRAPCERITIGIVGQQYVGTQRAPSSRQARLTACALFGAERGQRIDARRPAYRRHRGERADEGQQHADGDIG